MSQILTPAATSLLGTLKAVNWFSHVGEKGYDRNIVYLSSWIQVNKMCSQRMWSNVFTKFSNRVNNALVLQRGEDWYNSKSYPIYVRKLASIVSPVARHALSKLPKAARDYPRITQSISGILHGAVQEVMVQDCMQGNCFLLLLEPMLLGHVVCGLKADEKLYVY